MYQLIHGNCLDVLRPMADKSVDCIITDLPYAIGLRYGDYHDTLEDLEVLVREALPEMRRVARRVAFTCGIRTLHLFPHPTWILCWRFFGASNTPWGFSGWCPVIVYGADPDHRLRMRRSDVLHCTSTKLAERDEHPSPKPLGFMRKLVNRVAPSPTDVILDPFMGSGTTGVAAVQLGHTFFGIEVNGDYLPIAERRLAAATPDFPHLVELSAKETTP